MKKVILVALALVMVLALASCTNEETRTDSMTVEEGVLKVGMDLRYPPFETFDDDMNPMGISVDVAQALADELGLELEVVNLDFGTIIPALEAENIDIAIASMSITEERKEKVDFSEPYFYFKIISLMNRDYAENNGLTEDSSQDEMWALKDTRFVGLAGQISTDIPAKHGFDAIVSVDKSAAITDITTGNADVLTISAEVVADANLAAPETTMVLWDTLESSPIGMAVLKGNTELLNAANEFIASMDEDGVYDNLGVTYNDTIAGLLGEGKTIEFYTSEN